MLNRLQVQPSDVRAQLETLHPAGEQPVGDVQLEMTQQGKASIELAVQEARSLGHHYLEQSTCCWACCVKKQDLPARSCSSQASRLKRRASLSSKCSRRNKQRVRLSRNSMGSYNARTSEHHAAYPLCSMSSARSSASTDARMSTSS